MLDKYSVTLIINVFMINNLAKKTRQASEIYLDFEPVKSTKKPLSVVKRNRKMIAFGWYGGKFSHIDWLSPLLPQSHHYCDVFGGSAAVLINREPSPVETYNDIDGELVNFFRVLRNSPEEIIKQIGLTPFSREEYCLALCPNDTDSELERARKFYIRARQTRTGLAQTATLGRWANCKNTSRSGMSGVVSRWLGGVNELDSIASRLLRVQIENRPAIDIINLYDDKGTLFYCDPPYLHETRGDKNAYGFEMNQSAHEELAYTLNNCKGKVVLSGYDCEQMDRLYPSIKWKKVTGAEKTIHSTKGTRQEVVWMNFC